MRYVAVIGLVGIVAACGREPERSSAVESTSTTATSSIAAGSIVAYEDSLLDSLFAGDSTLTRAGDTLVELGGGSITDNYYVGQYQKNSTRYVKIERVVGYRPGERGRFW